jgi:hypothetical protein
MQQTSEKYFRERARARERQENGTLLKDAVFLFVASVALSTLGGLVIRWTAGL